MDASTIGAALFNEDGSLPARRFLAAGPSLIAPDLLFAEIASLSAKKVWRGEATAEVGRRALATLPEFVEEFVSTEGLASRAFELAAQHRFSAYDGLYLALAEQGNVHVVTLDDKLIARSAAANLGHLVARPR